LSVELVWSRLDWVVQSLALETLLGFCLHLWKWLQLDGGGSRPLRMLGL
jgi:hypothetical protein